MNVEPAPDESQLPFVVIEAVVTVRVPLVPPFIVKSFQVLVIALMVTRPPVPMVREPTVPPVKPVLAAEASSVDVFAAAPSVTDNVAPHTRVRVARVNVWAVPAEEVNVALKKWGSDVKLHEVKLASPVALSNVMVPLPCSHTAVSVDAQSKAPLTVHVSEPKSMADEAEEMFIAPLSVTAPDVLVRSPPSIRRLPSVNVNVALANVPVVMVSAFVTTRFVANVTVFAAPGVIVKSSNTLSEESNVMVAVASNV